MTYAEFIDECTEIRRRNGTRTVPVSYKFKQVTKKTKKNTDGTITTKYDYVRTRVATLLLYPDDDNHFKAIKQLIDYGYNFAMVIHDSDVQDEKSDDDDNVDNGDIEDSDEFKIVDNTEDSDSSGFDIEDGQDGKKKIHVHVVIYFLEARTNTAVAKQFGIGSNYVKMFHNLEGRLAYLTHRDNVEKYQYSPNKVVGTLSSRLPQIYSEYGRRQEDLVYDILNKIKETDNRKIIRFVEFAIDTLKTGYGVTLSQKYLSIITRSIDEHNKLAWRLLERDEQKQGKIDLSSFSEI